MLMTPFVDNSQPSLEHSKQSLTGSPVTGPTPKSNVNLFRARLGRAAPGERPVNDGVHLIKPPACAGRAPPRLSAALNPFLFESQFHLCLIHACKLAAWVGQIRGKGWKAPTFFKLHPRAILRR